MATKLRITVTKEILERSKNCGTGSTVSAISTNCAVALAVRDVFPKAIVGLEKMFFDHNGQNSCKLPLIARQFISEFDSLPPLARAEMSPISFSINVPDKVIEKINIDELKPLLENHPTLQLV